MVESRIERQEPIKKSYLKNELTPKKEVTYANKLPSLKSDWRNGERGF